MDSILLAETLGDLLSKDLKKFQWCLQQQCFGVVPIPKSKLENADIQKTVDVMVAAFSQGAVDVTLKILKHMKENDLAQKLERGKRGSAAAVVTPSSTSPSTSSLHPASVVNTASDGSIVFCPSIFGSTIGNGLSMTLNAPNPTPRP